MKKLLLTLLFVALFFIYLVPFIVALPSFQNIRKGADWSFSFFSRYGFTTTCKGITLGTAPNKHCLGYLLYYYE